MEISIVRQRVLATMDHARRQAAAHRESADRAGRAFDLYLERVAVPLLRQVANVLQAERHPWTLSTPAGSVRIASDRSSDNFIEIALEAAVDPPRVVGHARRVRGSRTVDSEVVVGSGDPAALTEEDTLTFVLAALEPFVER